MLGHRSARILRPHGCALSPANTALRLTATRNLMWPQVNANVSCQMRRSSNSHDGDQRMRFNRIIVAVVWAFGLSAVSVAIAQPLSNHAHRAWV